MLKFSISTGRGFFNKCKGASHARSPGKLEEGTGSSGIGVKVVVSHHVSAGDQMRIL